MQLDLDQQARNDLAQWGLCMRPQYLPTFKTSTNNDVRLDVLGNPLLISEDYACELDSVISGLKLFDENAHKVAKLYFVGGCGYRVIAEIMNINKKKVGPLLDCSISWVARGLYERNIKKAA